MNEKQLRDKIKFLEKELKRQNNALRCSNKVLKSVISVLSIYFKKVKS